MTKQIYKNVSHYKKVDDEFRGSNEKEWIISTDDKLYLFKKTQIKSDGSTTNAHYGELLYYDIATLLKEKCAKTSLAIRNGNKGIISEYFLLNDEELIDFQLLIQIIRPDFNPKSLKCKKTKEYYSLDLILQAVRSLIKTKENYQRVQQQIISCCILDALCGQYDRNPSNLALVKNYVNNIEERYRMSPIYDNGTSNIMSLPEDVAKDYLTKKEGINILQNQILSKVGTGDTRFTSFDNLLNYIVEHYHNDAKNILIKIQDLITSNELINILNQRKYSDLDQYHKELAFLRLLDMKEKIETITKSNNKTFVKMNTKISTNRVETQ